jgi:flagella basal body P-ring formation protein FlgA
MISEAMKCGGSMMWVLSLLLTSLLSLGGFSEAAASGSLAETVREHVINLISQNITVPYDSISVSVDLPLFGLSAHEVVDFEVGLMSSKRVSGTVPVRVTLVRDGGEFVSYAVTARVRIYDKVLVAARRFNRHEVVTEDGVRLERRDITHISDAHFTDCNRVAGKRVKRVITPGTLIRLSDVEAIPLVARGSAVTLSVVMGPVIVTSKAKALEDGEMNELIKVQDMTTGKRLIGTVAGKRLVILDESML